MRLRRLTEAECYTRCYGGKPGERVSAIRILSAAERRVVLAQRRVKDKAA